MEPATKPKLYEKQSRIPISVALEWHELETTITVLLFLGIQVQLSTTKNSNHLYTEWTRSDAGNQLCPTFIPPVPDLRLLGTQISSIALPLHSPQRTQTGYTQSRQDQMPGIGHVPHLFPPADLRLVGTRLSSVALPLHSAPPTPSNPQDNKLAVEELTATKKSYWRNKMPAASSAERTTTEAAQHPGS